MDEPIRILVSACLLGMKVRYDGGHKRDPLLLETFGKVARWVPICPEVGCGLPVPREPMFLSGVTASPRLVGVDSGVDRTERMMRWAGGRLGELESLGLCGYVCKKNSPSCSGPGRIGVFGESSAVPVPGTGIFTKAFLEHFPHIPVEEEGDLRDPAVREKFLEKMYAFRSMVKNAP